MPGTEVINVTAPADPCGWVFAAENKAAGGTTLEWAHYRLCQATNWILSGPRELLDWFGREAADLWTRLRALPSQLTQGAGNAILRAGNWVQGELQSLAGDIENFAGRVWSAVQSPLAAGTNALLWVGLAVLVIGGVWLTEH